MVPAAPCVEHMYIDFQWLPYKLELLCNVMPGGPSLTERSKRPYPAAALRAGAKAFHCQHSHRQCSSYESMRPLAAEICQQTNIDMLIQNKKA